MRNKQLTKEIIAYKKKMRELTHEFMKAKTIEEADIKLNALTDLAGKVATLKEERKQNGFLANLKTKLGL
jgi:hypothetical protein